uniref:Uncharacterized protein n=1 Tax=Anguilla anguilla TaxID=7936 RepID=A0A0E9VQU5_ANGAN
MAGPPLLSHFTHIFCFSIFMCREVFFFIGCCVSNLKDSKQPCMPFL